jgi:multidrug efflux pump subunit AcrB
MGSSDGCKRGFLFTLLTIITLGVASGILIAALVYFIKFSISKVSDELFIATVIAVCVSGLILFYGVWASIWGGKCPKALLAVFYAIYALLLGALGIVILALKKQIIDEMGHVFATQPDFQKALQDAADCQDWNDTEETCKQVIEKFYGSFGLGAGIALIALFVVLLVGDGFAWKWTCQKWDGLDDGSSEKPATTTPLRYSW